MKKFIFILAFLYAYSSFAQHAPWVWLNGTDSGMQASVYGQLGVPDSTNTPGSREDAMMWTDKQGNLWLFGGDIVANGAIIYFNDLWKYNIKTNQWAWMKGSIEANQSGIYGTQGVADALNTPGARRSAVAWADKAGNLWLFGGEGYAAENSFGILNDLWKYIPSTNSWMWVRGSTDIEQAAVHGKAGAADSSYTPAASWQSKGWVDKAGNFWLFGGNSHGFKNDLWKYNPSINKWAWLKGYTTKDSMGIYGVKGVADTANMPGARGNMVTWADSSGNLWLFGGYGVYGKSISGYPLYNDFNDLWKYTPATNQWVWVNGSNTAGESGKYGTKNIPGTANRPGGRNNAIGWKDSKGNLWLFGGYGYDEDSTEDFLNDLWQYTIHNDQWQWMWGDSIVNQQGVYGVRGIAGSANKPGGKVLSSGTTDKNGNFWLFGGRGYQKVAGNQYYLNDLWQYTPDKKLVPLTLVSFTVTKNRNNNVLNWVTVNEIKSGFFDIERSFIGNGFTRIGRVNSNNSIAINNYSFTDATPLAPPASSKVFYRLKMVDKDGSYTYSDVKSVNVNSGFNVSIYPNPVRNNLTLYIASLKKESISITIINAEGKMLYSKQAWAAQGQSVEVINVTSLSNGAYYIKCATEHSAVVLPFVK